MFERLQRDVFARGEFYARTKKKVRTIEELRAVQAEEGTHSILDMQRVSTEPAGEIDPTQELLAALSGGSTSLGTIYRMSDAELDACFETRQPTRLRIEANGPKVFAFIRRGYGRYTSVYEGTAVVGLYFVGKSGD